MPNEIVPAQFFASHLIARLASYGAEFWIAPGARSQSLAIAAAQLAEAGITKLRVRVDERSLGFSALGASVNGKPQVIITTSGTAVANLHPAVLEAHHAGVPLILLTADRPFELRGKGANQTTNQLDIFGSAVITCIDVEAPDDSNYKALEQSAEDLADEIVSFAMSNLQPAQLNIQFREPLSAITPNATEIYKELAPREIPRQRIDSIAMQLSKNCVVIAGANSHENIDEINELGLPIFAEPSSGVRHLDNSIINYRAALSKAVNLVNQIDQIVVYGKPTLSRPVMALLRSGVEVIVRSGRVGNFQIPDKAKQVEAMIWGNTPDPTWLAIWQETSAEHTPDPAEMLDRKGIVERVWQLDEDDYLVLGASQMIREADFYAPKRMLNVWANRGLSGIDGTIATATGIAVATSSRVRALVGDLTFLHDVGSLVIDPADGELDLQIIVVNDNGGKIFEYLEVAQTVSRGIYNRVFRTGQNFDIGNLAEGFGWKYLQPVGLDTFEKALLEPGRVIIEVKID